jgi:hypothetical protein
MPIVGPFREGRRNRKFREVREANPRVAALEFVGGPD